ncbi:MAG TPA: tRNA (guanosine(37)-N1)-methyltransferase TrmD [Allosphingosinicella sp.]|nr:tRNA (guanosine(37)-N1)-methyltransferase TrmD [Allosphingosinicella sp.]
MIWSATILTLYPEMFPGPLGVSLAGRSLAEGIWCLNTVQIRDFATDKHRSVDDTPAGGGAGMVMRADVLAAALDSIADDRPKLAMSPRGAPLTQALVRTLAAGPGVSILCGRFEGIDERLFEARPLIPVSVGDYVLSGGEPAAIALLDACVRLLDGVMGAPSSGEEESFESGLLEYPHYTRPQEWEGRRIPEVLRSGDHAKIAAWRKAEAAEATRLRRPDLIERHRDARRPPPSGAQAKKNKDE